MKKKTISDKEAFTRLLAGETIRFVHDMEDGYYKFDNGMLMKFQEVYPKEGYWNPTSNIYILELPPKERTDV